MKENISLYGSTGFIGSYYKKLNSENIISIPRSQDRSETNNILYLISTTTNYNIFDNPFLDIETNLTKLISVLEANKDKEDLVFNFVSSWFVYGYNSDHPWNENSNCNPKGFYSITKRSAEQLLISYCETFNINYRIIRLCNVIGSGDSCSLKKNALQQMISDLWVDKDIKLYDCGSHKRDYLHVLDVCEAIKLVINKAPLNEIINIGRGESYPIRDLIYYVRNKIRSSSRILSIEQPEFHSVVQTKHVYLDVSKLKSLGFIPRFDMFQSIDLLLEK